MTSENRQCQNCKQTFTIEPADFDFYKKIDVPAPTFCPECRAIRRMGWFNPHNLFRRPDSLSGKDIFSSIHKDAPVKVYDRDYWWSDAWDPISYGRDIDWSRPFLEQVYELIQVVPWPSRSAINLQNADYVANVSNGKNSYLCFGGDSTDGCAYSTIFNSIKDSFDLYEARDTELSYDSFLLDGAYRVFYSVHCEECSDVWFSRNLINCTNCFGCINLKNKSYHIFNKPVSKEEFQKFMKEFQTGSHASVRSMRERVEAFWLNFPERFTLALNAVDSSGEYLDAVRNVRESYSIHESENLKYCQFVETTTDSYDFTRPGNHCSLIYESCIIAFNTERVRFSAYCFSGASDIEYSVTCPSSRNLFGCVSARNKQYCILNKQYTKEEYEALVPKIKKHMSEMPYTDKQGRVYTYGEFFPPEFSPYAYNESLAQDYFPRTRELAEGGGFIWREVERREFAVTKKASELPDDIKDVTDEILKEVLECEQCGKAFRLIPMELAYYRRGPLPVPRRCADCRLQYRLRFVNPPSLWLRACQCAGAMSRSGAYQNVARHVHGSNTCPNEFETSYAPERKEMVYCESCYNAEVV